MEPANKKAKLDSRFRSPQKRETMEEICKGFVPANTKATGWAIGVFNSWRTERNQEARRNVPHKDPPFGHDSICWMEND